MRVTAGLHAARQAGRADGMLQRQQAKRREDTEISGPRGDGGIDPARLGPRLPPSVACATVLVDELVRCGLTDACVTPGSRNAPLLTALSDDGRVRLHVRIDERVAAFTALGLARATGRPALVATTSGTAAVELHPAIVEAHHGGVPLVAITADRPPELRRTGANQTIEQPGLYGGAVRFATELGVPEPLPGSVRVWRSVASRLWAAATGGTGGRPGPVHLNLPLRDPLVAADWTGPFPEPLDGRPGRQPWVATRALPRAPHPAVLAELAGLVRDAGRGALVLGDTEAETGPLRALADARGWPVIAEPSSSGRTGPRVVSVARGLLAHRPFADTHLPDLVVVVGRVGLSRQLLGWLERAEQVVLLAPHGSWDDPVHTVSHLVVADPALVGRALVETVGPGARGGWSRTWSEAEEAGRRALDAVLDEGRSLTEPRLARDLAQMVPDGTLLVAAASMPVRDLDAAMRPRRGLRVIGNRGAAGIDGLVSTAVGAALAHPGPTVALVGDLSLLHDRNALVIGPGEPRPDLVLIVVQNDGGGIFSFLEQHAHPAFERVFGTPHGVTTDQALAGSGARARRVAAAADLPAALGAALDAGGLQVLEVRTDRAENAELHRRLDAAVAAALDAGPAPDPKD